MLEVIVFICGAALMGIEFLAARMLAPSLGSSLFVWGSVISIVMVALSLGYWLGGQIADRFGSTRTLAPIIAARRVVHRTRARPQPPSCSRGRGAGCADRFASGRPRSCSSYRRCCSRWFRRWEFGWLPREASSTSAVPPAASTPSAPPAASRARFSTAFWLIPLIGLDPLVIGIAVAAVLRAPRSPRRFPRATPRLRSTDVAAAKHASSRPMGHARGDGRRCSRRRRHLGTARRHDGRRLDSGRARHLPKGHASTIDCG